MAQQVFDQVPFKEHTANGVTTVFAYDFQVLEAADMVVYKDGVVVPASEYTLAGVGSVNGGTVTFTVAPANGVAVLLSREIELARATEYQTLGDFKAAVVNPDFNRLWQALQGFRSEIGGALRFPYPEQGGDLPDAAARASRVLAFDSNGDPITIVGVDASSAAALALDLADSSNAAKNAGQVGFDPSLLYATPASVGWWLRNVGRSVLRYIPKTLWAGIIAGTNTTNLSSYLQAAFDDIETAGGQLDFHGLIYRCDTALDFRRASAASVLQYRYVFNGDGAILDFRSSGLTSGSCVKIGATAQANTNETGKIIVRDLLVLGPDSGTITATNARGGTTVGVEFTYCLNLVLENLHAVHFFKGYKLNFCFPVDAKSVIAQNCCIGMHIGSDCTIGTWKDCGLRNGRFGLLLQPDGTSGVVYGQTFDTLNLEGNFVAGVLDPLSGTGVGIHNIEFRNPYLEAITYDGFRLQRAFDSADASALGSDQTRDISNIRWEGGTWDAGGSAWGTSGHDAIRGPASSTTKPYSLRVNIPVLDGGMSLTNCRDVERRGAKELSTGATADNFAALGGYSFVRFDADDAGGTGTKTLRVAKNVTQVEKTSANGEFTITFARPYKASTSYCVTISCHGGKRYGEVFSTSTGSCVIRTYDDTGTLADPSGDVSVAIFGIE